MELKVDAFLKTLKDEKLYYMPNPGNGGDAIIAAGTFDLFKELKLNVEIINKPLDLTNQIVIYAGGGNLIKEYDNCSSFIKEWHKKVKKLIILPHTINSNKVLLESLSSNVCVFCREKVSYEYVKETAKKANVYLDNDMAFYLSANKVKSKWRYRPLKTYAITIIKKLLLEKKTNNLKTLYAYRNDIEKTQISKPLDNIDVPSSIHYWPSNDNKKLAYKNSREIFGFLDFFNTINTNRLHIAIAGALLGKKVFLSPNSYYKNEAIYEYSLKRFKNVTLVKINCINVSNNLRC